MKTYEPKLNTLFVVLGFLGDYMGRIVEKGKNLIEEFYPHEVEIAAEFETHLHNLIAEQNLKTTITRKVGRQGHVALLSPEIASLLNSYHVFVSKHLYARDDHDMSVYELPYSVFKPLEYNSPTFNEALDERLSYLVGVYRRFGKDKEIRLANGLTKPKNVFYLLNEISAPFGKYACQYVAWKVYPCNIPVGHAITFEPSAELAKFLGISQTEK